MQMHKDIDFREFARGVARVETYRKNDVIFHENDPPNHMYIVLSGSVEISRHSKVIETVGEGMAIGILSLLDGNPRATTARADGDCQLAVMDRRKFRYMVEDVPNFVWYVMNELAHRLRTTNAAV
jgi:CRP/FNR family cyclic AMP-dependent transcriptional regulator